jgi:hypothetical protein
MRVSSSSPWLARPKNLLLLLLLGGAGLRLLACAKFIQVDERIILGCDVFHFLIQHTFLPGHFNYPTFYSYMATPLTWLALELAYAFRLLSNPSALASLLYLNSFWAVFPARLTSLLFGLASIGLVYKIGNKWYGWQAALAAAAILALSPLHIRYSSFALPEALLTFLCLASVGFCLSALERPSFRSFLLAGAFAGLAASTKYNGALIITALLPVFFFLKHDIFPSAGALPRLAKLGGSYAAAFAVAFFAGSPGWIFCYDTFWQMLAFDRQHMAQGHLGHFGLPYIRQLQLLWHSDTTLALAFGLGIGWALWRRTRQDLVLLAPVLLGFAYIGSWHKQSLNYLLLLWPLLSLLAGKAFFDIARGAKRNGRWGKYLLPGALGLLLFLPPLISDLTFAYQQFRPDSREAAFDWIQGQVPSGASIVVDWEYIPNLPTAREKSQMMLGGPLLAERAKSWRTFHLIPLQPNRPWLEKVNADYLITSSSCFDRFFNNPPPPAGNPLRASYFAQKQMYAALLSADSDSGWRLEKQFDTGKGPRVLVFKRIADGPAASLVPRLLKRAPR